MQYLQKNHIIEINPESDDLQQVEIVIREHVMGLLTCKKYSLNQPDQSSMFRINYNCLYQGCDRMTELEEILQVR